MKNFIKLSQDQFSLARRKLKKKINKNVYRVGTVAFGKARRISANLCRYRVVTLDLSLNLGKSAT